jgi:hypothetical protein
MMILIIILKTLAISIGFSSALVNDIFTFKFLKDFNISKHEYKVFYIFAGINLVSALILAGCFIVSILYELRFVNNEYLVSSSLLLGFVLFSEVFFRRIVIKKLIKYRKEPNVIKVNTIVNLRRLAFILNTLSMIAWILLLLVFQFNLLSN